MKKVQTRIIVGAGEDTPAALQSLAGELSKVEVPTWQMQHFTVFQQMKVSVMNPQAMQVIFYAIAIVSIEFAVQEESKGIVTV